MRNLFMRLALAMRRARKPLMAVAVVTVMAISGILWWVYHTYPKISEAARTEEVTFWHMANRLTPEDRAALFNHSVRTGELPRLLPWWEYDRAMCSAVVVKYIALYTNIKLVHASAWNLRTARACPNCVGNERKLTTIWDATEEYASDGSLTPEKLEELTQEVEAIAYDPDKVYVLGLLWSNTHYWENITAENADINSHVALYIRGHVIQFIDMGDGEDPLKFMTLEELFSIRKHKPIWVAEVHEKTKATRANGWRFVTDDFRMPVTDRELGFEQQVWPWTSLHRYLVFPSKPWYMPGDWQVYSQKADTLVEKSLLFRYRNGYDPYPTRFMEVK